MNLIAVETSGRSGTIALLKRGEEVCQRSLAHGGRRHAQSLVADASELLEEFELTPSDIDCVAVSLGPGSFTGLRVGVVFAKTFGWINDCSIVAVPTFEACAAQVEGDHIAVISDAQRGELFFAEFDGQGFPAEDVTIRTIDEVKERLTTETILTGPALEKYADEFASSCHVADSECWHPVASAIAQLGAARFESADFADPWSLDPFYLRRSAAEEKRDANKQAISDS